MSTNIACKPDPASTLRGGQRGNLAARHGCVVCARALLPVRAVWVAAVAVAAPALAANTAAAQPACQRKPEAGRPGLVPPSSAACMHAPREGVMTVQKDIDSSQPSWRPEQGHPPGMLGAQLDGLARQQSDPRRQAGAHRPSAGSCHRPAPRAWARAAALPTRGRRVRAGAAAPPPPPRATSPTGSPAPELPMSAVQQ